MEEAARKIKEDGLCWYVVYTMSKAERKVKERLDKAGIDNYLPLQTVVRTWNGSEKQLIVPVISGCIFVRIPMQDASKVSVTQGVSFLLKEAGRLASISDEQMDAFKRIVTRGQLKGLVGELVDCQGRNKLMIRMDGLGYALATVSADCVEKC